MKPYENFSRENIYIERPHPRGIERLYKFDNGRGARVIGGENSGGYELVWILWSGPSPDDYGLDDHMKVCSNLTDADVDLALGAIAACAPEK